MSKVFNEYDGDCLMMVNDMSATFHMPKALKSENVGGKEKVHSLPPFAPRKAFKVDEYECPPNWMHGSGLASSYFVPIEAEYGMWLDFNQNRHHKHHVAVLLSIQGVNPVDGQSMVEIDQKISLKQYREKCPKHDIEFGQDRFCKECGYKWVPQNYLCTTGTPSGYLWLDGFLASDGVVRQYYFTEEEAKGVAHQIVGAEKKVYSIGIAFYLSKEPKPEPVRSTVNMLQSLNNQMWTKKSYNGDMPIGSAEPNWNHYCDSPEHLCSFDAGSPKMLSAAPKSAGGQHVNSRGIRLRSASGHHIKLRDTNDFIELQSVRDEDADMEDTDMEVSEKSLDIAAGAKIDQKVYADPENLDFWQDTPVGVLYVNYVLSKKAQAILKKGKKDLTKNGEGFLAGLAVGK
jgi:hypothetical protein